MPTPPTPKYANALEWLRAATTIVADTGEIKAIAKYHPQDATTNPSLILQAIARPQYAPLLQQAKQETAQQHPTRSQQSAFFISAVAERLAVLFGVELLRIIKGRVSTELPPALSFDVAATVSKAKQLLAYYRQYGIAPERVLLKIAATYEGLAAAQRLEQAGFRVNLTLVFSLEQALLAAAAKITLISPFVGRVLDWHKKRAALEGSSFAPSPAADPGVQLVKQIYETFQAAGAKTAVMAASFRTVEQILALRGLPLITISPPLLQALLELTEFSPPAVLVAVTEHRSKPLPSLTEPEFRWRMNQNAMASEQLREGLSKFQADHLKLCALIARP